MAAFLFLTFLWSWGLAAAAHYTGYIAMPFVENDPALFPFLVAFMAGPAIAALAVSAYEGAMKEKLRLRFLPNGWWLLAWAIPVLIAAAATAIAAAIPGAELLRPHELAEKALAAQGKPLPTSPEDYDRLVLISVLTIGPLLNMFGTLTEELGWRGYMLYRMASLSFWTRHLTIGFVWGVWHAPIIAAGHNYPGEPIAGIAVFTVFCMLAAPLIGLVAERGRSVLAAGLFHGTMNSFGALTILSLTGLHVFERGFAGWPGLVVMALGCAAIAAMGLDRSKHPDQQT